MFIETSDIRRPSDLDVNVLLENRIDQLDFPLSEECSLKFIFDLAWLGSARPIPPRHDRDIFPGRVLLPIFTYLLDHASDGKDGKIIVVIVIPIKKRKIVSDAHKKNRQRAGASCHHQRIRMPP